MPRLYADAANIASPVNTFATLVIWQCIEEMEDLLKERKNAAAAAAEQRKNAANAAAAEPK